jgi:hypothetical protein
MKTLWLFPTDAKLDAFCREIAREMVTQFGISHTARTQQRAR